MTKSQSIENAITTIIVLSLAASYVKPEWTWVSWACTALVVVGVGFSLSVSTPTDHERRRKGAWIIPAATLALAAQMVYYATPDERTHTLLLAAALVAAGVVLFWARRRAT